MSDLLEEMEKSRKSPVAIYQDFALNFSKATDVVFCFFEGQDDYKYYFSRIKKHTQKELADFDCNGKNNVLEVYKMLTLKYKDRCIMLFFIDRDFDEKCDCTDIFETPTYAIENLYITDSVFKEILKAEFYLKEHCVNPNIAKDFTTCLSLFRHTKSKFIEETLLLNAWYLLQKTKSRKLAFKQKPNLSKLKDLRIIQMKITLNSISSNYNLEVLKNNTENFIEVTQDEVDKVIKYFNSIDVERFIRGKYLIDFNLKFILLLLEDVNKKNQYLSCKRKISVSIGKNIISELSQYAETPSCLDAYLIQRLQVVNEQKLNAG